MTRARRARPSRRRPATDEPRGADVRRRLAPGRGRTCPPSTCPFCPGGLEAPEPYDVRWFPNRWPAMPDGRCEVVLYTPRHDATFWSLGAAGARRVIDLWAERTRGARRARRRRLRARVREPRRRGRARRSRIRTGRSTRSTSCPSCRCASSSAARRSPSPATGSSPQRPAGAPGCPRRRSSRTRCCSRPTTPCPTCRRSTAPAGDALAALLVDVLERLDRLFDGADAVHAVDPPAAVRRRRLAGRAAARGDRLAVARRRACRATSRRASSARASTSTRSRPRTRRARCARRVRMSALETLLHHGGGPQLGDARS